MRLLALTLVACLAGCVSRGPGTAAAARHPVPAGFPQPERLDALHVSRGLPAFGEPGPKTICVVVCGWVNRPGYYHLPTGSLAPAGIEAAQGFRGSSNGFKSKIIRCRPEGASETVRFPWEIGVRVPELRLNAGDIIYLGKETYP